MVVSGNTRLSERCAQKQVLINSVTTGKDNDHIPQSGHEKHNMNFHELNIIMTVQGLDKADNNGDNKGDHEGDNR